MYCATRSKSCGRSKDEISHKTILGYLGAPTFSGIESRKVTVKELRENVKASYSTSNPLPETLVSLKPRAKERASFANCASEEFSNSSISQSFLYHLYK